MKCFIPFASKDDEGLSSVNNVPDLELSEDSTAELDAGSFSCTRMLDEDEAVGSCVGAEDSCFSKEVTSLVVWSESEDVDFSFVDAIPKASNETDTVDTYKQL